VDSPAKQSGNIKKLSFKVQDDLPEKSSMQAKNENIHEKISRQLSKFLPS